MKIASLHIYPIKSCAGIDLSEAAALPRGLQHDRRWMIIDDTGKFITQREHAKIALIKGAVTDKGLQLSAPGMPALDVQTPSLSAVRVPAQVWKSALELPVAAEASEWLSGFLGLSCRLVHLPDYLTRTATSGRAKEGDEVSLADGFPLLITTTASLADLNSRLPAPLPMNRFRPNMVIEGAEAWAEDSWREIQIGDVTFELMKPCSRCNMTQIEQTTGVEDGKEPIRTLRRFRFSQVEAGVLFGMNATPRMLGSVKVGDSVTVRTTQTPPELLLRA